MSVKFFGQFLIERGEIDAGQLRDALELMDGENHTLGELAVQEKMISREDADRINREQRTRDRTFGELGIELELLRSDQVEHLVRRQQQARLPLGLSLVRLGHLSEDRLGQLLEQFKLEQAPYEAANAELPESLAGNRLAAFVLELLPKLCMRMARLRIKVAPGASMHKPPALPYAASVAVHGAGTLEIGLLADREFAAQMAAGVSGFDATTIEEEFIADGVGEFLNVLVGNAMAPLEREGVVLDLEPARHHAAPRRGTAFELVATDGQAVLVLADG